MGGLCTVRYLKMADFPHALTQAYIQLILLTFYVLLPYVINYVIRNNDAIIRTHPGLSSSRSHVNTPLQGLKNVTM